MLDGEAQLRLIAREMVGEPTQVTKLRERRLQGGTYTLYELEINDHRFYGIDIYTEGSHAAMMADDEQIEQVFGFEALPD